jgi:uncharacterized membrane protein
MLTLIIAVLVLTIVCVVVWAITEKMPDPTMRTVVRAVAILIMLLMFLKQYGSALPTSSE